ncbi:hypothetical protein ACOSOMT5_P2665 [Acidiphilium sp. MT5]
MPSVSNAIEGQGIKFIAEEDDFVKAALLNSRLISRLLRIYAIFLAIIIGVSILRHNQTFAKTIGMFGQSTITFLIFLFLYRIFIIPAGARRTYQKSPLAHETQLLVILPDQILIRSDRGEIQFEWKDFVAWQANKYVTLLYISSRIYIIIPSRLAEQGADIDLMHFGLMAALGKAKQ